MRTSVDSCIALIVLLEGALLAHAGAIDPGLQAVMRVAVTCNPAEGVDAGPVEKGAGLGSWVLLDSRFGESKAVYAQEYRQRVLVGEHQLSLTYWLLPSEIDAALGLRAKVSWIYACGYSPGTQTGRACPGEDCWSQLCDANWSRNPADGLEVTGNLWVKEGSLVVNLIEKDRVDASEDADAARKALMDRLCDTVDKVLVNLDRTRDPGLQLVSLPQGFTRQTGTPTGQASALSELATGAEQLSGFHLVDIIPFSEDGAPDDEEGVLQVFARSRELGAEYVLVTYRLFQKEGDVRDFMNALQYGRWTAETPWCAGFCPGDFCWCGRTLNPVKVAMSIGRLAVVVDCRRAGFGGSEYFARSEKIIEDVLALAAGRAGTRVLRGEPHEKWTPPPQATPTPPAPSVRTYTVGGPVTIPVKVSGPPPAYTDEARQAGVEGVVAMEVTVSSEGKVTMVRVGNGLSHGLTEAAVEAVKGWTYKPGTLDGEPLDVRFIETVRFSLGSASGG
jgi:TonB family protein